MPPEELHHLLKLQLGLVNAGDVLKRDARTGSTDHAVTGLAETERADLRWGGHTVAHLAELIRGHPKLWRSRARLPGCSIRNSNVCCSMVVAGPSWPRTSMGRDLAVLHQLSQVVDGD